MDATKLALDPASAVRSAILISTLTVQTPPPMPQLFATLSTKKCYFQFIPYPPGDCPRYCNACGQSIAGFVYHCRKCGNYLHPCCAALPHVINANGSLRLHLHHKTSAPCDKCGWKGKSWCYRSDCKKINLHVACAIKLWLDNMNELHYGRGDSNGDLSDGMTMVLRNKFPIIEAEGNNRHRRSWMGKLKKCSKLAVLAVKFIIAAMLGDPTTLITGVITSLLSE
ncbi:uncharacterized protein LOC110113953 [Dendrobium catenatum]|uniref:uncharacterized protein LOC110113953 n=1 Tax=Dendrobium catenatum TaxID=906689 RepID=UPI0009F414EB|nr:uncharacterized protein LOC110113953 [Dendrobium catenatum]